MTQDIGTALCRHEDFNFDNMIYVTGNEQNYHFQTLFKILEKIGCDWSEKCFHLSYGMVDLPTGKMKSREGTVVDADDLIFKMRSDSLNMIKQSNKFDDFDEKEIKNLSHQVGDGALKYFILKVDAKKNMMFNPDESIDFNGNTGPFIQYTYARIMSILSKRHEFKHCFDSFDTMGELEKDLIKHIIEFPNCIQQCKDSLNPSLLANYIYHLAKTYNKFYQKVPILDGTKHENFRLTISKKVSLVIKNGMSLLGIDVPNRM
jgi:arginyl-tRNA synthetase